MEVPQEGKYECKLNDQMVIYEASTGSLCGAMPCVMIESGYTFKHTVVLVKADGTVQTKTMDTLKALYDWDGLDPFWLMDNSVDGGPMRSVEFEIVGGPETGDKGGVYFKSKWLNPLGGGMRTPVAAVSAAAVRAARSAVVGGKQVSGARWCVRSGRATRGGSDGRAEDPHCSQVRAECSATWRSHGDDGRGVGGAERGADRKGGGSNRENVVRHDCAAVPEQIQH